ncbi:multidrug efflux SMR transporter [Kineococcus sp. TBRC 1896]|uniref:Multidrug efflux SMR transporter n=1 Tax=Kineococcus mangrovi TaxID=1660183 RepID=A0ABV4I282_9ACTN
MTWLLLAGAVVFEVAATAVLRVSDGGRRRRWLPVVAGGYLVSFGFLSFALRAGMPVGIAYGVWSAVGIALTALLSRAVFGDPLTRTTALGLALIAAGVVLVELGAR